MGSGKIEVGSQKLEAGSQKIEVGSQKLEDVAEPQTSNQQPQTTNPVQQSAIVNPSVSALSLASIRAKKELEAKQNLHQKQVGELPKEPFNETDMLLQWNKYAQRLADNGKKLMETYMQMNIPTLNGTTIHLILPNESTKEEFLSGSNELLGYLRGKLHNHDISIDISVSNEVIASKYAFTPAEKFEKLKNINPAIELLKKTFDLDL